MRTTARGTESVHWYSRIWPTDNRDVTEVKTAVPFLIVPGQKARGFPGPPTRLRLVVMVNKSVQQHYVTLMWAHSLLLPLFLFFLWFSIVLLHHGDCRRESFLSSDNAWCVMDIPIHVQCKESSLRTLMASPLWTHGNWHTSAAS